MCVCATGTGEGSQYGQRNLSLSEAPTRIGTRITNHAGKRPRQFAAKIGGDKTDLRRRVACIFNGISLNTCPDSRRWIFGLR